MSIAMETHVLRVPVCWIPGSLDGGHCCFRGARAGYWVRAEVVPGPVTPLCHITSFSESASQGQAATRALLSALSPRRPKCVKARLGCHRSPFLQLYSISTASAFPVSTQHDKFVWRECACVRLCVCVCACQCVYV